MPVRRSAVAQVGRWSALASVVSGVVTPEAAGV